MGQRDCTSLPQLSLRRFFESSGTMFRCALFSKAQPRWARPASKVEVTGVSLCPSARAEKHHSLELQREAALPDQSA